MKNLLIAAVLMITLTANSQINLDKTAKELYTEFQSDSLVYKNAPDGQLYLAHYVNEDLIIQYFFSVDSVCISMLVNAFSKKEANKIIDSYTAKGYFKVYDEWLVRENGNIYTILHFKDEGGNYFYWY
jgi:hypothetical protein